MLFLEDMDMQNRMVFFGGEGERSAVICLCRLSHAMLS